MTTVRLPDEKMKLMKAIAGYEGKSLSKIFDSMAEEYISRHMETMELLKIPDFHSECITGLDEIKKGKGRRLSELAD
jgi:predicted DNA-binding protein